MSNFAKRFVQLNERTKFICANRPKRALREFAITALDNKVTLDLMLWLEFLQHGPSQLAFIILLISVMASDSLSRMFS